MDEPADRWRDRPFEIPCLMNGLSPFEGFVIDSTCIYLCTKYQPSPTIVRLLHYLNRYDEIANIRPSRNCTVAVYDASLEKDLALLRQRLGSIVRRRWCSGRRRFQWQRRQRVHAQPRLGLRWRHSGASGGKLPQIRHEKQRGPLRKRRDSNWLQMRVSK